MNFKFNYSISKEDKVKKIGFKPIVVWFYGLSGSGKSSLLNQLEKNLFINNIISTVLDGDELRDGLNYDLGFTNKDRKENLRRTSEVAKILINNGHIVLCAFITPLNSQRELINKILGRDNIFWIYVDTPFDVCASRDTKGLYKKALQGKIKNFTSVDQNFEVSDHFDLKINGLDDIDKCADEIFTEIFNKINGK